MIVNVMQTNEMRGIIDSNLSLEKAIAQNPNNIAPKKVLSDLEVITVNYFGFDEQIHEGQIVMHRSVAEDMRDFFAEALRIKFPIKSVIPISVPKYSWSDELSCADNNTAGYNYRPIAGTTKMSKHSRGLAFDLNPAQNIFLKYDSDGKEIFRFPPEMEYNPQTPGTLYDDHVLVKFLEMRGWEWGGRWTKESGRIDYQHFEKDLA